MAVNIGARHRPLSAATMALISARDEYARRL